MSQLQTFMRDKHYKQGSYQQVVEDLTKLIAADPRNAQLYKLRADAYLQLKKQQLAIADYTKAIEINPENEKAYCNRGIAYKKLEKYNEAIADYSKAIEIKPNDDAAYYNRGIVYSSLNKFNEAIADFSKAIEIKPNLNEAYNYRGSVHSSMKKFNEAIADYSKAIEIKPNYDAAYHNRGNAFKDLQKYKQAQADYLKAIQISPNDPLCLLNLGNLYLTMSLKQKAEQYFLKCIDSFQRSTKKQLNQKYKLSEGNIKFIQNTIQEFEKNKEQIAKLRKQAEKEHRNDLINDLVKLDQANAEVGLLKVAFRQLEDKQKKEKGQIQQLKDKRDKQNKEKSQLQKVKDQLTQYKLLFDQNLEQMQKQMKRMYNIQKEQIQTLKYQNQTFKQQQKDLKQRFDIFEEKMQQEVKKMSQKIFAVQNVLKKIENLSNSKQREYYRNLYSIIINHFLAYRVLSTGFFTQDIKSLSTADGVLQKLCKAQPIIEKIPIIGDLIGVPFQIISAYRQQKSSHINSIIAGKIIASELKTESLITQFMAHAIQQLMKNQHFNEQLKQALKEEKGSFIGKIQAFVTDKKGQLYSKVFGTNKQSFSFVNKVVVSHMTLLTLKMCEIEEEQFVRISKDKAQFYSMVIKTISPDLKEKPKDAIKNQPSFSINQAALTDKIGETQIVIKVDDNKHKSENQNQGQKPKPQEPQEQKKGLCYYLRYYLCCQCLKSST